MSASVPPLTHSSTECGTVPNNSLRAFSLGAGPRIGMSACNKTPDVDTVERTVCNIL